MKDKKIKNKVVHIFGASGAGTSTLGRYICEKLDYFHMDTDDYFWEQTEVPYTQKRCIKDRIALMKKDIEEHENVVISGSLTDWGDEFINLYTLAIRLETDKNVRINRLKEREREEFGSRLDKGGDMYENHMEFIEWAAAYDDGGMDMRSKMFHDEWQKKLKCKLLMLDGNLPLEENFKVIEKELENIF